MENKKIWLKDENGNYVYPEIAPSDKANLPEIEENGKLLRSVFQEIDVGETPQQGDDITKIWISPSNLLKLTLNDWDCLADNFSIVFEERVAHEDIGPTGEFLLEYYPVVDIAGIEHNLPRLTIRAEYTEETTWFIVINIEDSDIELALEEESFILHAKTCYMANPSTGIIDVIDELVGIELPYNFKIGTINEEQLYANNHLNIAVYFQEDEPNTESKKYAEWSDIEIPSSLGTKHSLTIRNHDNDTFMITFYDSNQVVTTLTVNPNSELIIEDVVLISDFYYTTKLCKFDSNVPFIWQNTIYGVCVSDSWDDSMISEATSNVIMLLANSIWDICIMEE